MNCFILTRSLTFSECNSIDQELGFEMRRRVSRRRIRSQAVGHSANGFYYMLLKNVESKTEEGKIVLMRKTGLSKNGFRLHTSRSCLDTC